MAEAAGGDVAQPVQVLHDKRIAEPELRHVAGAIGLAELGEALGAEDRDQRVARQHPQDHEDDERDAEHGQRAEGQATNNVVEHGDRLAAAASSGQGFR